MNGSRDLFEQGGRESSNRPLAERIRPHVLDEIIGHATYLGEGAPLYRQIREGRVPSMILWGPPGVGKTTLARAIAAERKQQLREISAVSSGVKDVKEIIARARRDFELYDTPTLLFIDEIHRFNKAQQDALLHATEQGVIILIGATTENPSFEVNSALLSRCSVVKLELLDEEALKKIVQRAIAKDVLLSRYQIHIENLDAILFHGGGDARKTLNLLERSFLLAEKDGKDVTLDEALVEKAAAENALRYDKKSDYHYDTISAFIKSIRGSDPDAALYWLARMLDAGEDPLFIARRLIISASEDVGNAEPYALTLANAAFEACHKIGLPEARIILGQATAYLASVPKSNAAYLAINKALEEVKQSGALPVPLHLRNAPTGLMKKLDYGKGYKYAHDYPGYFVEQQYLPDKLKERVFYEPSDSGRESRLKEFLRNLWPRRREDS